MIYRRFKSTQFKHTAYLPRKIKPSQTRGWLAFESSHALTDRNLDLHSGVYLLKFKLPNKNSLISMSGILKFHLIFIKFGSTVELIIWLKKKKSCLKIATIHYLTIVINGIARWNKFQPSGLLYMYTFILEFWKIYNIRIH